MKQRNAGRIISGILMLISGCVAIIFTAGDVIIGSILLVAGFAFVITGILRHRREGDNPESDERSKKIGAYGLSYACLTGLFFMFDLFWLDYLGILRRGTQVALVLFNCCACTLKPGCIRCTRSGRAISSEILFG